MGDGTKENPYTREDVEKIINEYEAYSTILPNRKYYNGKYWDSLYFNITKDNFNG